MKRIVASARENGVPVVWTRVEYEPGGANGGYFYKKVPALKAFDRGSPLAEWVPGLEPADGYAGLQRRASRKQARHSRVGYLSDFARRLRRARSESARRAGRGLAHRAV